MEREISAWCGEEDGNEWKLRLSPLHLTVETVVGRVCEVQSSPLTLPKGVGIFSCISVLYLVPSAAHNPSYSALAPSQKRYNCFHPIYQKKGKSPIR